VSFPSNDHPYTSVVVPSLSLDPGELAKIPGASFLEERLLFLLIRLRNPWARLVYVTSLPLHPLVLEYYLQLLAGVTSSHARSRLTLLCAYDSSPEPLTQKVLERPRLIERIPVNIPDRTRAYLTAFNSTPLERLLAVLLGIPLNGPDPDLVRLGTKSGSRRIFREAGVDLRCGREDVHTEGDVLDGEGATSPSVQMRVNPTGRVFVASTHEQILGGPTAQVYKGCRFPAGEPYRLRLQEVGLRVGEALAGHGVMGRFSVDFLARPRDDDWDVKALEINLRMGGTTRLQPPQPPASSST